MPLRNDLVYLLQNDIDINDTSKSLFLGDKNDEWERRTDNLYRKMLRKLI